MTAATAKRETRKTAKSPAARKGQTKEPGMDVVKAAAEQATPATLPPGSAPAAEHPKVLPAHLREIPPNAYRTLSAIREMGYGSLESIMDLIDNSIDADAKSVSVQVRAGDSKKGEAKGDIIIDVLDDGVGMDEPTLAQALRLGSDTERDENALGKYGMGLVSASLSMAQHIHVLTRKAKAQAWEATFDMTTIREHNKFLITLTAATDSKRVLDILGDRGTLVRLSKIDRINDTNVARFAASLRVKVAQVFRTFIKAGLKLSVNGRIVRADDPLMRDHPQTEIVLEQDLVLADGVAAKLTVVELPDLGTIGDQEAGIYPNTSGFYVTRNGRQIIGSETLGFYRHHHSYSHFRAEVAFTGNADHLFHVDIKKATIHPDETLLAKLREATADLIAQSGKRGRDRGDPDPVALKLDHATDVINSRLGSNAEAADSMTQESDSKEAKDKGEAKDGEAAEPEAKDDEAEGETEERKARRKFRMGQIEAEPHKLMRVVDKDGTTLVELNTKHPVVRLAADAKHKGVSSILTYFAFALAQCSPFRQGDEMIAKVGEVLADILGVAPDAQP